MSFRSTIAFFKIRLSVEKQERMEKMGSFFYKVFLWEFFRLSWIFSLFGFFLPISQKLFFWFYFNL
jgi:hypothetical protein